MRAMRSNSTNAISATPPRLTPRRAPSSSACDLRATATVATPHPTASVATRDTHDVVKVVLAARMARSIREFGHLAAKIDPLGSAPPGDPMLDPATHGLTDADLEALPAAIVWPNAGPEAGSCRDALDQLRAIYCGGIGYDFDHVQNYT